MNREPVVVTGLGLVSPLGSTVSSFWTSLVAGQSGIGPLTRFDASDLPVRFGGEAKGFDPLSVLSAKDARRLTRFIQFAVWAAVHAWRDAGLEDVDCDRDRAGVFIGSGMGALDMLEEEHRNLLDKGPGRVSPFLIPGVIVNMAAGVPATSASGDPISVRSRPARPVHMPLAKRPGRSSGAMPTSSSPGVPKPR